MKFRLIEELPHSSYKVGHVIETQEPVWVRFYTTNNFVTWDEIIQSETINLIEDPRFEQVITREDIINNNYII